MKVEATLLFKIFEILIALLNFCVCRCLSRSCQMMFFSATYGQEVMDFAEVIVPNPFIIRLKREEESLDNIQQYYVKCANEQQKYAAVTNIYGSVGVGQAIIFCQVSLEGENVWTI